jgi:hypothetical protein
VENRLNILPNFFLIKLKIFFGGLTNKFQNMAINNKNKSKVKVDPEDHKDVLP